MKKYKLNLFIAVFLFLLMYSGKGFCQSYKMATIPINEDLESKIRNKVPFIDSDGFLWYTIREGIVKELGTTRIVYPMKSPNNDSYHCHSIFKTSQNELWVGTNIGVYSLNLKTGNSFWIQRLDKKKNSLIEFTSFIEDSSGTIWIGTKTNKLFSYSIEKKIMSFEINRDVYGGNDTFNDMFIKDILVDGTILIQQGRRWLQFKNNKFNLLLDFNKLYGLFEDVNFISFSPSNNKFITDFFGNYTFSGKTYYYYYVKNVNKFITSVPYNKAIVLSSNIKNKSKSLFSFISSQEDKLYFFDFEYVNKKVLLNKIKEINTDSEVIATKLDHEGNIIVQTREEFLFIKELRSEFTSFLNKKENFGLKSNISCRSIVEQSDGTIIVFSPGNGFFKLQKNATKFEKLVIENETKLSTDIYGHERKLKDHFYGIHKQNDSILWGYGYGKELYRINIKTKKAKSFLSQLPGPLEYRIYEIEQINDHKLVIGGNFGLGEFDLNTGRFEDLNNIGKSYDFKNKTVGEIYLNKQKSNLWVGMLDNYGLCKIDLSSGNVTHFNSSNEKFYLINNNVRCIYEDMQNDIWVGTENGLQRVYKDSLSTSINNKVTISNENVTGILDHGKFLWYGTFNGLKRLNKKTGEVKGFYKYDGLADNEFNYKSFLKTSNNQMFFGGINGLTKFNPEKIKYQQKTPKIYLAEFEKFDLENGLTKKYHYGNDTVNSFEIPYEHNYLTLKFAINNLFYFKNNSYRYRIKEINKNWETLNHNGILQLNGVKPSIYTLEIKGITSKGNPTNTLIYKIHFKQIFYKSWWFLLFIGFITIIGLSSIIYYKIKKIKNKHIQKIKLFNLESKALRAQMDSHFIFNILNSIQNLVIQKNEREANRVFTEFAKLIRYTLDMNRTEFIYLEEEVEYLKSYLSMEKIRLNNDLEIDFKVDPELMKYRIKLPCMFFQPIIENAIIHGLKPKIENRKIEISFDYNGDFMLGTIKDNGIGREAASKNKQKKHNSVATHILNERIRIFNHQKKNKISIKFIDLKNKNNATGSIVKIWIPITF